MKGQSELVGLLVIVVLLIVVGIVYLRFSSYKEQGYQELRSSTTANNILRAIAAYNIEGYEFDAASYGCYAGDCQGLNIAAEIVNASIGLREYGFWIEAEGKEIYRDKSCSVGILASYPFTYEDIFFEAKLKIC